VEVKRERLTNRIAGERVTVIKAPSGFGKSTLVKQFVSRNPDIAACCLSVRHLDKYSIHFLRRFVAEFRDKLGKNYFVRSKALVEEGADDTNSITQCFVKELAEVNMNFVIIVDGVDELSADSTGFIKDVLRYSREDIAFAFVTESDLDSELERAAEWSYERIGTQDLAFTDEEVSALFDSELNASEVETILEYTGGWAFGVTTLHRVWDRAAPLDSIL